MLSPRLAGRYAKSLLKIGKERNELKAVHQDMLLLQETLDESKDLRIMLKSPVIPSHKKEQVLNKVFSGKLSEITEKFINLLVNKGREKHLDEMVDSFVEQYNKMHHIVKAKLTTAVPVSDKVVAELKAMLLKDSENEEVIITTEVDPTIVGGFVLQYGDQLIDSSIERKLQIIKKQIQDESYISKI